MLFCVALRRGLADADNGNEAGAQPSRGLGAHRRVAFVMVLPPFGVADDDVGAALVFQHRRADVAGMSALGLGVAVLAAERDTATRQQRPDLGQQGRRRADQEIACRRALRGTRNEVARQGRAVGTQPVHLPVSRDQLPHRPRIHPSSAWLPRYSLIISAAMLQAIRSRASGIVVQILFGVLILTFALWGIGDIFRGRGADTSVASVGGEKIDGNEVSAALRRQVDRMRQMTNATLNDEQIKELGLLDTTLTEVINQHLLDLEARRLGLAVNDDAVRQAIIDNPAFHGTSGQFDRNIYLQLLQANRMTDQQYETLLRTDMIRNRIVATITDGAGALPTPDAATLQKFYDAHKDNFMVPERRSFPVALIDPSQYMASIKIPDDQLK